MNFCSQCGSARRPSDKFCGGCGSPFAEPSVSRDQTEQRGAPAGVAAEPETTSGDFAGTPSRSNDQAPDSPDRTKGTLGAKKKWLFALVSAGLIAAFVVVAVVQDSSTDASFQVTAGCVGCTPAQLETMRENREKQAEARNRDPYGGQCVLVGPAALDTSLKLVGLGYANFDIDSQRARDFVVSKGYESFDDWIADVENLYDFVWSLDQSQLSPDEIRDVDTLTSSLKPGEMTRALLRADTAWFENFMTSLISLGVDCDGQW